MTEQAGIPRRRSLRRYLLVMLLLMVVALAGLIWYASTSSFQAMVRRHVVSELERITGGKVELGGFHTTPFRLRLDLRDLTIHGREQAGETAYVHIDRVMAEIKVISFLGAQFGFSSVFLDHPVVHIVLYPDGTTNQPQPAITDSSGKSPVESLFSFSVARLGVQKGELIWQDQRIPLEFTATDLSAGMSYSHFRRRFESSVILGKVDTKAKDFRPFSWRAEAQFGLGSNRIDVSSLKWFSGPSRLEASGRLENFRQPKITGTYKGSLDLAQISAITRQRDLRAGVLEIQGKGSWALEQFVSDGKFFLRDVDWRGANLSLQHADLSSDFFITNQQVRLSKMDGRLLGGSAVGDMEIANWQASLSRQPAARGLAAKKSSAEEKGLLRLRLKGLSVAALANALTTPARPLNRANLVGTAEGSTDAQWRGSLSNLDAQIALQVTPPAKSLPPELPLSATVRANYRASRALELNEFSAGTPASQARASGVLSSTSSLKVFATTTNLREWQPIMAALNGPTEMALAVHGHATFNGIATGHISSLSFTGNLQANDFISLVPAAGQIPGRQIRWDSLTANLQFSPDRLSVRNGVLRHAGAEIRFDVNAALDQRRFLDTSPFSISLNIHNADLTELQSLVGYHYPFTGRTNLIVRASGTRLDPHGEGHFQLTNATLYGQPFARASADLQFVNGEAEINNIQAFQASATVTGAASYNLAGQNFHFNLEGRNFDLAQFPELHSSRFTMDGRMDFTAQGSGTPEQPALNAQLRLRDLTFDNERAGNFILNVVSQGPDLRVTGNSQFASSELTLEGTVRPHNDWPADLTLHFNHLDIDPVVRAYFRDKVTGHSAAAGDIRVRGPLLRPRDLEITAILNEFLVDIQKVRVINDGPIRFSLKNETLDLQQLHLVGDLTDFAAHGTAQLSGQRALDMRADGHVNLKLIESFNPDFSSSGTITAGVSVSGTVSDPLLQGRVEISDGAISYIDLPSGLSNMNGTLTFNQDRLQIETLTARTGGGSLNLGGSVTYFRGTPNFDLSIQGQDIRLRYPPGASSTANTDLRLIGNASAATLSGDITVTKLAVTPGFDFASYLERSKQSVAAPTANSLLNRLKLDVHVTTTPDLQMQTAVAKLTGDADLRARGTAAKPVLLGRVDILEGEVNFNGAKYRLERGDVTFNNPVRIDPVLDLQATTRVSDYDVTVNLTGEVDKLRINWRSDPPLPETDIVSLLALGRAPGEQSLTSQGTPSAYSPEASNMILSQALTAAQTNRAQRLFGISRIKIDPQGLGSETSINRGAQVSIEQQVYNNLTLTYSTNVSQTSEQIIQLEYNITRNLSIVALRDYNGVVSFDVKLRRRKK